MAEYLASIFGTEKDKVNCSFYYKIGACRHGDNCSRIHNKPTFSQTVLLKNLYITPENMALTGDGSHIFLCEEDAQKKFDEFYQEIFVEINDRYGEIEEMRVCDNLGEHLVGNVYVMFRREEDAEKAINGLNNRWFGKRPIYAEFSPVTDFRDACCAQYEQNTCSRAGHCNFMHVKKLSREADNQLRTYLRLKRKRRSRSRSTDYRRSHDRRGGGNRRDDYSRRRRH